MFIKGRFKSSEHVGQHCVNIVAQHGGKVCSPCWRMLVDVGECWYMLERVVQLHNIFELDQKYWPTFANISFISFIKLSKLPAFALSLQNTIYK